eukprot:5357941-Pleurochrysis_carterae.AAC.2
MAAHVARRTSVQGRVLLPSMNECTLGVIKAPKTLRELWLQTGQRGIHVVHHSRARWEIQGGGGGADCRNAERRAALPRYHTR